MLAFVFRLSWHGWPVNHPLANALQLPLLNVHKLQKPHELCGSGFHLPCTVTALLCFLASVQVKDLCMSIPRPLKLNDWEVVQVPQNGRCFITCLHVLLQLQLKKQKQWANIPRTQTGMPLCLLSGIVDQKRLLEEEKGLCKLTKHVYIEIYRDVPYIYIYTYIFKYFYLHMFCTTKFPWTCYNSYIHMHISMFTCIYVNTHLETVDSLACAIL